MTATNIFYNFVGFRYSPPLADGYSTANSDIVQKKKKSKKMNHLY